MPDHLPDHRSMTDAELAALRDAIVTSRRAFILAGMGAVLAGCAQTPPSAVEEVFSGPMYEPIPVPSSEPIGSVSEHHVSAPPAEIPKPRPPAAGSAMGGGVISRTRWATGQPVPSLMNRMTPIRYVTVHHDGMRPFYGADPRDAASRLDAIRRAHRSKKWGDIGYHFAVDRSGNVWEARPLRYQGAHVKNYNAGNIGVVALGNFDEQHPTPAQLEALHKHVLTLTRTYRVSVSNIRTHMQWAPTRCPGTHLQRFMDTARGNGMFG